jgi:hypothetical protein
MEGWDQIVYLGDWLGLECIQLGQGRVMWSALVNVVMNFWVLAPPN